MTKGELDGENDKILALLKEAREWLCEHPESPDKPRYEGNLRLRWWCTQCKSYLRGDEDYTLIRRIDEAIK